MLEFIVEIVCEFLLQTFLEALCELGLQCLAAPFEKPPNPWLAAIGYATFGAAAGGISLWFFPSHFVRGEGMRIVNLLATPVGVGLLMSVLGAWRARRGRVVLRIDRFAYGYLFALALALVRFQFAK